MKNANYFFGTIVFVLGLIMLVAAKEAITLFVVVLGVFAIFDGLLVLFTVLPMSSVAEFRKRCLVRGLVSVLVGLGSIIAPLRFAKIGWKVFVCIFAVYLLFSAILEIMIAMRLRDEGISTKSNVLKTAVLVVLSLLLFLVLAKFGFALLRIIGVVLMIAGAVILFSAWQNRDLVDTDAVVRDDD